MAIQETTRKLEVEQRRLNKLDKDLELAEAEYDQKRRKYNKEQSVHRDKVQEQQSKLIHMERHLERAIKTLNRENSENERLRDAIDRLRRERQNLDAVFKQLEKGIGGSGHKIKTLKERIDLDCVKINEAEEQIAVRTRVMERRQKDFHEELKTKMGEIKTQQEEETRTRVKKLEAQASNGAQAPNGTPTAESDALVQSKTVHNKSGRRMRTFMVADEEASFSEVAMYRRILKLSFLNTIQRRHITNHHKNIEVFEQAFATIKQSTGISDIEEIVKIFIGLEQRNFSLLTYVNQLNREIEAFEIRNNDLKEKQKARQIQDKLTEERRDATLNEIKVQIDQAQLAIGTKDTMAQDLISSLEECKPSVIEIVRHLKTEVPQMMKDAYDGDVPALKIAPPDDDGDVSLNHLLLYIEEMLMLFRINDLASDVTIQKAMPSKVATKPKVDKGELPSTAADDSDDDPDGVWDRPLSRGSLQKVAETTLAQRKRQRQGQQV